MSLAGLRRATDFQLLNRNNDYNPQRVRRSLLGECRWNCAAESTSHSVIVCPKLRESSVHTRSSCSASLIFDSPTLFPNSLSPPDPDQTSKAIAPAGSQMQLNHERIVRIRKPTAELAQRRIHLIDDVSANFHIDTLPTKPRSKTIRSFNARLNSLAQKGNYVEVLSLIEDVENGTITLSGPVNTYSFTILLKAYCNAANLPAARKLLDTMHKFDEHKRPNRFTYNTLMNAFIRWEDMKGATELFELMETSPHPNIRPDHVTYTTLMKGYAASGDMKGAAHLFQRLRHHPDPDCRPNQVTYNTMLKGFVAEGNMDSADHLLEQMSSGVECRPDIVSMNTIIGGYARQGNLNRARHHLEQMRYNGIVPNPVTFHALIEGSIRHGEIDYADKLFQFAINHDNLALSAATYRVIIEAWLRAGDTQKAKFAFSHQTASNDEASLPSHAFHLLKTSEDSQTWLMERTSSMFSRNSNRNRYSISSAYHTVTGYSEANESEQCALLRFPVKRESVGSVAGDDNASKLIYDQY